MISPSEGMRSPASQTTRSPLASAEAATRSSVPSGRRRRASVSARMRRRVSAWALPRPSAMASAKLAKITVRNSQTVIDQANRLGCGDGLDEGDHGADQDHEHDRVPDLHPRVQLLERVDEGPAQDLAVEEAPGLGHPVSHRRGRRRARCTAVPAGAPSISGVVIRRTFRGRAARRSARATRPGRRSGRR